MQKELVGVSDNGTVMDCYSRCLEHIGNRDHLAFKRFADEVGIESFNKVLAIKDSEGKNLLTFVQKELDEAKGLYKRFLREGEDRAGITKSFNSYNALLFVEHIININTKKLAQAATQA